MLGCGGRGSTGLVAQPEKIPSVINAAISD